MASTEQSGGLHPLVRAAAAGRPPGWVRLSPTRREHMRRVADLMDAWAAADGLGAQERGRWRAAAWLHDALREADPEALRPQLPEELRDLPASLLHGPACAERLRREGVADEALLAAIAYHTVGHPTLDRLGRALYLADFLDPARPFEPAWRASLAARMPANLDDVLREVLAARVAHLVGQRRPIRSETLAFWNSLAAGD